MAACERLVAVEGAGARKGGGAIKIVVCRQADGPGGERVGAQPNGVLANGCWGAY